MIFILEMFYSFQREIKLEWSLDFGGSKTFEEYEQEQDFELKLMKKQLFEDTPELIGLKSIDRLAIIRKDWLDYADFLAGVIGNTRKDEEVEFEEIENLIVLLEDNDYWKLENILQTIKEYFDKEIANCSAEGSSNSE